MEKLRMAKKIFQRSTFYKQLTYITLIFNYKAAAICAYFRKIFFKGHFWWRRGAMVITTTQLYSTKPELRFCADLKSCWWHVGDSRWWGSLTMVLDGNKAKRLLQVNHTTNKQFNPFNSFGNHLTSNACQNVKFCEILKIWKKLKNGSFFS